MKQDIEQALRSFERKLSNIESYMYKQDQTGANLVKCVECGDPYPRKIAEELTGKYCVGCYKELNFDVIPHGPPPKVSGGTPNYFQSLDEDPAVHNGIRALEGD